MSVRDTIEDAMLKWLQRSVDANAAEVTSWEDKTIYGGYCETCAYEEVVVLINYRDNSNKYKTYEHYSSFVDFLWQLDQD